MTDRRSGPPLFDLMRDRGERAPIPTPASTPAGNPTLQPKPTSPLPGHGTQPSATPNASNASSASSPIRQTAWDSTGGVSRAERSAAAMLDEPIANESGITLSVPKFYTLIAVALVLIVGAWAGGYQIGKRDGKDEMSRFVADQPVVRPPSAGTGTNSPALSDQSSPRAGNPVSANSTSQQQTSPSTSSQPTSGVPTSAPSSDAILTASGYRTRDPRTAGMNYLVLATLPMDQAADAIGFMNSNGLSIIGVPQLDSRRSGANNPSRYTLYSLGLAIPGNQWSSMSNQRLEHQQMIANLGAKWQRERRGGSDFSQTNWEKYEP